MNSAEKPKRCHNCAHWEKSQTAVVGISQGVCKMGPPSAIALPVPQGIQIVGHFPPTAGDCYCGCHRAKLEIAEIN